MDDMEDEEGRTTTRKFGLGPNLRVQTTSPRTPQTPRDHDWDAEARQLFRRLNLEAHHRHKEKYRNLDAVYRHPSGARLFVGNQTAARSESVLVGEEIFHIVNCQDESSANFFERDHRFQYKRFPVSHWWREQGIESHQGVLDFFEHGCHAWIEHSLAHGHNVLVHCLAGAHRAGTTGVSFMMRAGRFDVDTAVRLAKWQRPIIDPFGQLLELLHRLQAAYEARGDVLVAAVAPPPPARRGGRILARSDGGGGAADDDPRSPTRRD